MQELKADAAIMAIARNAFLYESGGALIKKYACLDEPLFTEAGYREYAFDLLERMTNPFLADTVERAGRHRLRKLGVNDRIFGTMSLALEQGIEPVNMALGAMAAIAGLLTDADANRPANLPREDWREMTDSDIKGILEWIWGNEASEYKRELIKYVCAAREELRKMPA
jgi:mannitol-1-phosphate/altronate dehydrogenase